MITLRKSAERGFADHGWLKSFHSFSFADYFDPQHMGVGNLRVINEDRIAPGTGFGTHGHRDMEIVSYVLSGALAHKDSMGNGQPGGEHGGKHAGVIRPGDVGRMSAGTGVQHSEFNHAQDSATHFLQIWLLPSRKGMAPDYEQKHFDEASKRGRLRVVAAPDGRDGALTIHADATLYSGLFSGDERVQMALDPQRIGYVHLVRGRLRVNDHLLRAGDAARLDGERQLVLEGGEDAEVLVFDLAA
jgi:quercetin 2,3-dioxygenase